MLSQQRKATGASLAGAALGDVDISGLRAAIQQLGRPAASLTDAAASVLHDSTDDATLLHGLDELLGARPWTPSGGGR